jgi:predicted PurR-regulated permease PerM
MTAQQTLRNTLVVVLTLALAYALFLSARILIVLFIAIIVASSVRPAVLWLQERRIPQALAILLVYFVIAVFIFTVTVLVVPPSMNRLAGYITNEDRLASRIIAAQTWIETAIEQRTGSDVTLLDPETIRTTVTEIVEDFRRQAPALAGEVSGLLGDSSW